MKREHLNEIFGSIESRFSIDSPSSKLYYESTKRFDSRNRY